MSTPYIDRIEHNRQVALHLLKPSQRDLEYGLKLHEESMVVESYSLGLHAPPNLEELNAAIDAGASDIEFQDLVENGGMTNWLAEQRLLEEYICAWRASGVNCMFLNAGEEGNSPLRLLKRLARYVHLTDQMPDFVTKVVDANSLIDAHKHNTRCIALTLNGVPLAGTQTLIQEELQYIKVFAQLGVKMMHLTYNRRNLMGDGCAESANGGLSDFGRAVVEEMNRLGVIIDAAHTGWQTTIDAAKCSKQPIVISHAGVWNLSRHIRCKTDEVISAVVDGGGTLGITNIPRFLGGSGDINALLDHIDYGVQKFGEDAVTIGTDDAYRSCWSEAAFEQIKPRGKCRPRWENFWPPGQEVYGADWSKPEQKASLAWTNWPLFTVGLVQRGYSDAVIRKIIGGNLLRVVQHVWPQQPV